MEIFDNFISGFYGSIDREKEKTVTKFIKGGMSKNEFIKQMEALERKENERKDKSV